MGFVINQTQPISILSLRVPWKPDFSGSLPSASKEAVEQGQRDGKCDEWSAEEDRGVDILDGEEQKRRSEEHELQQRICFREREGEHPRDPYGNAQENAPPPSALEDPDNLAAL